MPYNPFPVNYNPFGQYYQPQQQPQQAMTPPTIHAEIIQVAGEQEALTANVAAGVSQMMMARDESAIFIKTAYANGQSKLDVYKKQAPAPTQQPIDTANLVTKQELEERIAAALATIKPKKGE